MTNEISLYNAAVAPVLRALNNLEHILKLGESNANERGIDESVFLTARLAPDMFPLTRQVQIAASLAKACPYRLAGKDMPTYEDTEKSFKELYALLAKAKADISAVDKNDVNERENKDIVLQLGPEKQSFTGRAYGIGFILPNVYFHCTTVYNILRHNGVPLGKRDFFGGGFE